jgi:hypothetical protein
MRAAQPAQAVEVVALDDEVAVFGAARRRVALLGDKAGPHDVGVQRLDVFDGVAFPIKAELLARQVLGQ